MRSLILLFLPLIAWGQDCSHEELSRECFRAVCEVPSVDRLPTDVPSLEQELRRQNFSMPREVSREMRTFADALARLNERHRNFEQSKGFPAIASETLQAPLVNLYHMRALLDGKVYLGFNGASAQMVVNDLDPNAELYTRLGNYLKNVMDITAGYIQGARKAQEPGALVFYQHLFLKMESFYLATNPARANQIAIMRRSLNASNLMRAATMMPQLFSESEVQAMIASTSGPMIGDLSEALRIRSEDDAKRISKRTSPDALMESFSRSCGLAHFMMKRIEGTNPLQKFETSKNNALDGLRRNYLPTLSTHTRSMIERALQENPFETIDFNRHIYPDFKMHTSKVNEVSAAPETSSYLQQFGVFNEANQFACAIDSFIPEDYFDGNKISTSLFTVGMGYSDVLAHELGHWLSHKLSGAHTSPESARTHQALRSCITGFYQNGSSTDGPQTEEDFADLIAAKISPERSQVFCSFNTIVPMFMSYLSSEPMKTEDPYERIAEDSHSNSLFRVLHQKMVRGENIPTSCTELMSAHPEAAPKRCQ